MLRQLRKQQQAVAVNQYWRPVKDTDDFRVIVWKGVETESKKTGETFPVIVGWEVEAGVPFKCQLYRHIEWQLQEAGRWPVEPGTIVSLLFLGMGETEFDGKPTKTFQFHVDFHDPSELTELGPRGQQRLLALLEQLKAGAPAGDVQATAEGDQTKARMGRGATE